MVAGGASARWRGSPSRSRAANWFCPTSCSRPPGGGAVAASGPASRAAGSPSAGVSPGSGSGGGVGFRVGRGTVTRAGAAGAELLSLGVTGAGSEDGGTWAQAAKASRPAATSRPRQARIIALVIGVPCSACVDTRFHRRHDFSQRKVNVASNTVLG
jgi:hypothetical protein